MGTPGGADEELPRHRVAVRSYCMDTFEITVADWRACVEKGACTAARPDREGCTTGMKNKDDHPVNCIDWTQADAYCQAHDGRLPTEREWEYAARGGAEQRSYPWGNDPPDGRSCYAHPGTCKVGSYKPHAFGIHDLGGNLWEWTASVFGPYPKEHAEGPLRVYRGGSFSRRFPKWMRNGLRNRMRPTEWGAHLGARCAHDLAGAPCPEGSREEGGVCLLEGEAVPTPPRPTGPAPAAGTGGVPVAPVAPASKEPPKEPPPVTMTRDPSFDDDCKKHKPGRPVSYMIRGGGFGDRQAKKGGCSNRDVGVGWNSVCCAQ